MQRRQPWPWHLYAFCYLGMALLLLLGKAAEAQASASPAKLMHEMQLPFASMLEPSAKPLQLRHPRQLRLRRRSQENGNSGGSVPPSYNLSPYDLAEHEKDLAGLWSLTGAYTAQCLCDLLGRPPLRPVSAEEAPEVRRTLLDTFSDETRLADCRRKAGSAIDGLQQYRKSRAQAVNRGGRRGSPNTESGSDAERVATFDDELDARQKDVAQFHLRYQFAVDRCMCFKSWLQPIHLVSEYEANLAQCQAEGNLAAARSAVVPTHGRLQPNPAPQHPQSALSSLSLAAAPVSPPTAALLSTTHGVPAAAASVGRDRPRAGVRLAASTAAGAVAAVQGEAHAAAQTLARTAASLPQSLRRAAEQGARMASKGFATAARGGGYSSSNNRHPATPATSTATRPALLPFARLPKLPRMGLVVP